jgi:hypothetical protein
LRFYLKFQIGRTWQEIWNKHFVICVKINHTQWVVCRLHFKK